MKFDYNIEIEKILNKIYEYKICEIAYKNNLSNINKNTINNYKDLFKNNKVYFGSDLYDFIISLVPKDKDGYYFRCEIANYHNYLYPRLYDYLGNPLKNTNYNKFTVQLWESNMNDLLIEEIERNFSQKGYLDFIDKNLIDISENVNNFIKSCTTNNKITIKFLDKENLLDTMKSMILDNKLELSWAQLLVDMDKLRSEMIKFSTPFHIYNEFDKLEDNLDYCLNTFCKYNSNELFDILTKEYGFKYITNLGLVKD